VKLDDTLACAITVRYLHASSMEHWTLIYDERRGYWTWRCGDRNGERRQSLLTFDSFSECVEDAKEHGFSDEPCHPAYQ
jgi:hypothetical protein